MEESHDRTTGSTHADAGVSRIAQAQLKRAYRADTQFGPQRPPESADVAWIGIGAGGVRRSRRPRVGMSTGPASAEVLAANQREVAATSIATSRQFASSRLAIVRATYDSVRRAYNAGKATGADLENAKSEVDTMEANAAQIEVDARSAGAPKPRSCLSLLRAGPIKNALPALVCSALASAQTGAAPRQQGVPVVSVTAPLARTTTTFGAILEFASCRMGECS